MLDKLLIITNTLLLVLMLQKVQLLLQQDLINILKNQPNNAQMLVPKMDSVILQLDNVDAMQVLVEVIVVFLQLKHALTIVIIMENVINLMVLVVVTLDLWELIANLVKILLINVHTIKLKLIFAPIQVINNMQLNVCYSVKRDLVLLLDLLVLI